MSNQPEKQIVFIAGMHRSGTSATARFLNLIGAKLPIDLVPPSEGNNPKGFWEPRRMAEINTGILADNEMVWHSLGSMPDQWVSRSALDARVDEAAEFIDELDKGWLVLKDPRLSRLLPFWAKILDQLEIPMHVVIPYRNPLEVCLSLSRRDRFSVAKGMVLWLRYNLDAELWSRKSPRLFISFNELIARPARIFEKCSDTLPDLVQCRWKDVATNVREFLDPAEKHYSLEPAAIEGVDETIQRVFEALDQDDDVRRRVFDEVRQDTQIIDGLVGKALNQFEWERGMLRRKIKRLEHTFSASQAVDVNDQQPDILDRQQKLDSLLERLGAVQASIEARVRFAESHSEVPKSDPIDVPESNDVNKIDTECFASEQQRDNQPENRVISSAGRTQPEHMKVSLIGRVLMRLKYLASFTPMRTETTSSLPPEIAAEITEISRSRWFDAHWYLRTYPDVRKVGMDPAKHFVLHGWREARDPSPNFSVSDYLEANPDVKDSQCNPVLHFIHFGKSEGRLPKNDQKAIDDHCSQKARTVRRDSVRSPLVTSTSSPGEGRIYEDLNGNRVELTPVPAFGSQDYELTPTITGPVLILPLREEQFPISILNDLRVAVHLHLHHIDLLDEFADYLSNIPISISLFVSITDPEGLEEVKARLSNNCPKARLDVRVVQNRGRDIASLVTEFADQIAGHDLVGHFHSKRSIHNPAKADWRSQLLHGLLGSNALVQNIFSLFVHNPQVGMVFPEYHWSLERQISWGGNFDICKQLAGRTGLSIAKSKQTLFPAGSMFWARADALDGLLNARMKIGDFQKERGQVDGTVAHAIERLFGEYVSQAGYQLRQIKPDRQHSLRSYFTADWPYFPMAAEEVKGRIESYRRQNAGKNNRIAVYTAIVGEYDMPVIHEVLDPDIDYYLFSDRSVPDMGFWRVHSIAYHHPEPVRKARYVKTHPHALLPEYDLAIWIDGNVLIRSDISVFLQQARESGQACIYGIDHPHRRCLYDEARTLTSTGKDKAIRIQRQIQAYRDAGYQDRNGLIETNFMVVDLTHAGTKTLMRHWWGEIVRYSHRDQLSINYSLWATGQKCEPIFTERHSLRSHPGFAYFSHYYGSDRPADNSVPNTLPPPPLRSIAQEGNRQEHGSRPAIDIVVCVHNALDDVRECLKSVLDSRLAKDKIIIVDDASDKETSEYLVKFAHKQRNSELIRLEGLPQGYCRSANVGLRAASGEFVLLLNSDAILPSRGLYKLGRAMQSSGDVAVVGPLSNAASSQSIPEIKNGENQTAINALPNGVDLEMLDSWCEETSAEQPYPRVPLIHGFCQLIRISVLKEVGLFDEVSFPHGYGEENDFCFRVGNAGYDMLIAADTYVFHRKSASYSDENRRKRLMAEGGRHLQQRYGSDRLNNAIQAMQAHPVLEQMRESARRRFYSNGKHAND